MSLGEDIDKIAKRFGNPREAHAFRNTMTLLDTTEQPMRHKTMKIRGDNPLTFIKSNTEEWEKAWQAIEDRFGCRNCADEHTGEVWQYMGTCNGDHEFRHRNYNGIGRKYIKISTETYTIEE